MSGGHDDHGGGGHDDKKKSSGGGGLKAAGLKAAGFLGMALIGLVGIAMLVGFFGQKSGNANGGGGGGQGYNQSAVFSSTNCPAIPKVLSLAAGSSPVTINPHGVCVVKWRTEGQVLLIDSSGRSVEVGPQGGSFDNFWTESVQAARGNATFHYMLVAS